MKKLLFFLALCIIPATLFSQYNTNDDDLYYRPSKQKTVTKTVSQVNDSFKMDTLIFDKEDSIRFEKNVKDIYVCDTIKTIIKNITYQNYYSYSEYPYSEYFYYPYPLSYYYTNSYFFFNYSLNPFYVYTINLPHYYPMHRRIPYSIYTRTNHTSSYVNSSPYKPIDNQYRSSYVNSENKHTAPRRDYVPTYKPSHISSHPSFNNTRTTYSNPTSTYSRPASTTYYAPTNSSYSERTSTSTRSSNEYREAQSSRQSSTSSINNQSGRRR